MLKDPGFTGEGEGDAPSSYSTERYGSEMVEAAAIGSAADDNKRGRDIDCCCVPLSFLPSSMHGGGEGGRKEMPTVVGIFSLPSLSISSVA